jgi:hypothetical protein
MISDAKKEVEINISCHFSVTQRNVHSIHILQFKLCLCRIRFKRNKSCTDKCERLWPGRLVTLAHTLDILHLVLVKET